jgi:hypothetical protein
MSDGDPEVAFRSLVRAISSMKVTDGGESEKMTDLRKEAELSQKRALLEKYTRRMVDLQCNKPSSGIFVLPIDLSEVCCTLYLPSIEVKPSDRG